MLTLGGWGFGGGATAGRVKRLPSTSCPSIIDLPRSSTCMGDVVGTVPAGACGAPDGAAPGIPGGIGRMVASFFA